MKKLERLAWVEKTFGAEFILRYFPCRALDEICGVIDLFESRGATWGMRTDFQNGQTQGFNLPFLWKGSLEGARKIWDEHQEKLVYIVSENILNYRLNGVAEKLDDEHVFFEWNEDPNIPQRKMYGKPADVRRLVLGPSGYVFPYGMDTPARCVNPEDASWWRFDQVYDLLVHSSQTEATFSVRDDGKLVIW